MGEKIILKVGGMSCDGCAANVQRALKGVEGVISAEVHLASKTAIVTVGDKKPLVALLIAAVKQAGYEATAA